MVTLSARRHPVTGSQMTAEMAKLNKSQRDRMRGIVSGNLVSLTVTTIGWKTRVECVCDQFRHVVDLGPRGMILDRNVFDA
jgi:hypothetical protein